MATQIQVHGLTETVRKLRNLPQVLTGKRGGPIRKAAFQGAKVIKEEAIRLAPQGDDTPNPGRLRRNIILMRDRNPRVAEGGPTELYHVGVRGGSGYGGRVRRSARRSVLQAGGTVRQAQQSAIRDDRDAYYWRFVEFGTSKMPARPFLRPAFESQKEKAVQVFSAVLKREVDRIERSIIDA